MHKGTNPRSGLSYTVESAHAPAPDDDAALVSSSQEGDLEAFERLVVRHQKRMLNVAYRLTNDYDEACEIVQDAFVSAFKNIKTFRGEARFTTWLTAITLNLSKNRLKQMRSRRGHEAFSLDEQVETDDGRMTIDPPSKEPSILDRLEARDIRMRVQSCIKALEPDFREALVLRDLQDFSYEEIGGMLKIKAGTVKSRISRARELMKECLKKVMEAQ